jgi:hypothetical protein
MGLLLCTALIVLVGMGTREVRDAKQRLIVDEAELEQPLSEAEEGWFYVVIYAVMGLVISMTVGIIIRRAGGLRLTLLS